jgi:hypothetical protein
VGKKFGHALKFDEDIEIDRKKLLASKVVQSGLPFGVDDVASVLNNRSSSGIRHFLSTMADHHLLVKHRINCRVVYTLPRDSILTKPWRTFPNSELRLPERFGIKW